MAARKLQAEIDRTLKRVREGVDEFEAVYDKLHNAVSQAQKEKTEGDLKTMIKKLQRLRDHIKTWLQSNEVKDKTQLLEHRRLIETQMETFKAVEREMKTKAFSKEGLSAAIKKDPAEEAKEDATTWLCKQVDHLSYQVEVAEAEIEQLVASKKGRKGSAAKEGRVAVLKEQNDRSKWHINRLELLLRLVENDTAEPEKVMGIRDDVDFFVDNNTEQGLINPEDYEYIYEDFNLDEEEEAFGLKDTDDMTSSHDDTSSAPPEEHQKLPKKPESIEEGKIETSKDKREGKRKVHCCKDKEQEKNVPASNPMATREEDKDGTTVIPHANFSKPSGHGAAVSPTIKASAEGSAMAVPPIQYAAAAAAAVATSSSHPSSMGDETEPLTSSARAGMSPIMIHRSRSSVASTCQSQNPPSPQQSTAPSHDPAASSSASASASEAAGTVTAPAVAPDPAAPATVSVHSAESAPSVVTNTADQTPTPTMLNLSRHPPALHARAESSSSTARLPPSLAPLLNNFDSEAFRHTSLVGPSEDLTQAAGALNASAQSMPDALDSDRPKYYVPRTAYPTPAYYPQEPLPIFGSPELYHKLDPDTLFFIFYYQQGTYHQYLAARELKHHSWRFHKQYLTWFQRLTEPVEITSEYECGTYIYFDWEGNWRQRKKQNFRFEYRWIEDL